MSKTSGEAMTPEALARLRRALEFADGEHVIARSGDFDALLAELSKARRERDDALAALRHARSVIPHGLPGSLYAVARGVVDAVLEDHDEEGA